MEILGDAILETTTTQGTGALSMAGAQTGHNAIRDKFADGAWGCFVAEQRLEDSDGNLTGIDREIFLGKVTYGSPDTISRPHVISSTNADANVNFGAGTKDVYCAPGSIVFGWNLAGVEARTSNKTLNITHNNLLLACDASGGAYTQSLPAGTDIFPGYRVGVIKTDSSSNAITVDGDSADTINGAATDVLSHQYLIATYVWDGSEWFKEFFYNVASQSEAEAGVDNTKVMTPLRVKQAIDALSANVGGNIITSYKGLIAKYASASTITITADEILLEDANGKATKLNDINHTIDITSSGANGLDQGSEGSSRWYAFWEIYNGATKAGILSSCQERTTDGTTAGKLEDSSEAFDTDGTAVGDIILNMTDDTRTVVTAIDDANTLSVRDDIFASGETYVIIKSPKMPSGYTYKGLLGFVYNNSSSDFHNFRQSGNKVVCDEVADLIAGTATSPTAVPIAIPPLASLYMATIWVDCNSSSNAIVDISPTLSATLGNQKFRGKGTGAGTEFRLPVFMPIIEPQTIYYDLNTGDGVYLYTTGWEY